MKVMSKKITLCFTMIYHPQTGMACEEDIYFAKVEKLGYAEYDNDSIIGERVHNFVQLKSLNTVVALVEIGEIQYKVLAY